MGGHHRLRALVGGVALVLLACQSIRPYEGPAPGSPDSATIFATNLDRGTPYDPLTSLWIDVYEPGGCTEEGLVAREEDYAGSISLTQDTRFAVPAGPPVFMRLHFESRVDVAGAEVLHRCQGDLGLIPKAGKHYELRLRFRAGEYCRGDILDEEGNVVTLLPEQCTPDPRWWPRG